MIEEVLGSILFVVIAYIIVPCLIFCSLYFLSLIISATKENNKLLKDINKSILLIATNDVPLQQCVKCSGKIIAGEPKCHHCGCELDWGVNDRKT